MTLSQSITAVIIIQLIFSFCITVYSYSIPDELISHVNPFKQSSAAIDLTDTTSKVQKSLEEQTSFPLIDLGALAFFSGNIIIDLLLNFAFAIPEMIALLLTAIFSIFSVDVYIVSMIQGFASAAIFIWYFMGLISLVSQVRNVGGQIR